MPDEAAPDTTPGASGTEVETPEVEPPGPSGSGTDGGIYDSKEPDISIPGAAELFYQGGEPTTSDVVTSGPPSKEQPVTATQATEPTLLTTTKTEPPPARVLQSPKNGTTNGAGLKVTTTSDGTGKPFTVTKVGEASTGVNVAAGGPALVTEDDSASLLLKRAQDQVAVALHKLETARTALDRAKQRSSTRQRRTPVAQLQSAVQGVDEILEELGGAEEMHPVSKVQIAHGIEEVRHVSEQVLWSYVLQTHLHVLL